MEKLNLLVFLLCYSFSLYSQGNAIDFDGIDDEICATVPPLSGDDITIQLWAKPDATQVTFANIIDTHTANGIGYTIEQNISSTNEYYFAWGSGSGAYNIPLTFTLTPNIWQHLTIVKSGTNLTIYINGVQTQSATGGNATLDPGTSLRIGNWIIGGRNWAGCLDDVRIWDKALSGTEILNNYNVELVGNEADLILYYTFNQGVPAGDNGSGCPSSTPCEDMATDISSSSNIGDLKNFSLDGSNSNWVLGFVDGVLPIDLLYFDAIQRRKEVLLQWKTHNEFSNSGFELQHSDDGRNWEKVDFIEGYGFSNQIQSYSYKYQIVNNEELIYFRLKQIDFNGNSILSKVISVTLSNDIIKIYPNPVSDYLFTTAQSGYYYLFDLKGNTIKHGYFNSSQINFTFLKAGIYQLKLIDNNRVVIHNIIKM